MRLPKKYGQSKVDSCPFCGKMATAHNKEGIPVCPQHKDNKVPEMKCACGDWLDLRSGKFGPFFSCMNCGNISFRKALDMNPGIPKEEPKTTHATTKKKVFGQSNQKEITITSDDIDYF